MNATITHKHLRNLLDNLNEENFADFLVELQFSTLIIPANEYDGVPIVEFGEEQYVPLFTDIHEFDKFENHEDFMVVDHEFNEYLELLESERVPGFVINPDSERFTFAQEFLKYIRPNFIFNQDYQPFTNNELKRIRKSMGNDGLNEFLKDESNRHDLNGLVKKLEMSTLLTLLVSDKDYSDEAEDGIFNSIEIIPKCLYGMGDKNYILLFSREPTKDVLPDDSVFKYVQLVNFSLLVEEVLNYDFDGFILNLSDENIIISREHLRDYVKDLNCPPLDWYGIHAFTLQGGD